MDVIEYKHLSDANYLKVQLRKAKNKNKKYFKIYNGTDSKVASFKKKRHRKGLILYVYIMCIVCNRCLYRRSVILFLETQVSFI